MKTRLSLQGKLYDYQLELIKEKMEKNEELRQFVEMCFDPESAHK